MLEVGELALRRFLLALEAAGDSPRPRRLPNRHPRGPRPVEQGDRDDRDDDPANAEAAGDERNEHAEQAAASTAEPAKAAAAPLDFVIGAFLFLVEAHGRSLPSGCVIASLGQRAR